MFFTLVAAVMSAVINPILWILACVFIVGGLHTAQDSPEGAVGLLVVGFILAIIGVAVTF